MKRISRPLVGLIGAALGGLAVFVSLQFTLLGRETGTLPRFNIQDTPIDRETHGVTSYASIIKQLGGTVILECQMPLLGPRRAW